ncbi:YbaB/EbfC family nucleoid-associated protein [Gordonia caeni]|uniref:Nucleoid-associated protein n=1 Tax=Gordonia caeni TaxID=1007097 RepID=A0ABP7NK01_9ACTN
MNDAFGAVPGFGDGSAAGGSPDRAQQIQEQLIEVQRQIAAAQVTGSAGGGVVTVAGNGIGEVTAVSISPDVDRDDLPALEGLVLDALADLAKSREALVARMVQPLSEAPDESGPGLPAGGPPLTADGLIDLS